MDIYKDGVKVDVTGIINNSDGVVNDVIDACCLINKKIYEKEISDAGWSWTDYSQEHEGEIIADDFVLGKQKINSKQLHGRPDCSGLTWMIGQLMGYYYGAVASQVCHSVENRDNDGKAVRIITNEYDPNIWLYKDNAEEIWNEKLELTSDWEVILPENGNTFKSDGSELKMGDLMFNSHHIQIFGTVQNGHLYVWNWGDSTPIKRTRDSCMQILNQKLTGNDRVQALIDHDAYVSGDSPSAYNYALRFKGFTNSEIIKFYMAGEEKEGKSRCTQPTIRLDLINSSGDGISATHRFNSYKDAALFLRAELGAYPPGMSTYYYHANHSVKETTIPPAHMYHLTIEDGGDVIEVPLGTFSNLHNIKTVSITGSGVLKIAKGGFANCKFLESVSIGDDTEWIGTQSFVACYRLKTLNLKNVKMIGGGAFAYTPTMETLTIPDSVLSMGPDVFGGLTPSITEDPAHEYLRRYIYPDKLKNITIGSGLKKLPVACFTSRYNLESITIPSTIQHIGGCAFQYCESLSNVSISDGTQTIGNGAFDGCTSLSTITFPSTIVDVDLDPPETYYDEYSESDHQLSNIPIFRDCTNLTTINCYNHNLTKGAPWGATNATVNYL